MADVQRVPAEAPPAAGGQQLANGDMWTTLKTVGRMILMYYAVNAAMGYLRGAPTPSPATPGSVVQKSVPSGSAFSNNLVPLWDFGTTADLKAFVSENEYLSGTERPIWEEMGLVFGEWEERRKDLTIDVPESVQHNGSLYAHFFLTPRVGSSSSEKDQEELEPLYYRKLLTRYMPKKKTVLKKKLVVASGEKAEPEQELQEAEEETPIISYWWNNVTLEIVNSRDEIPLNAPPLLTRDLRVARDGIHYYPFFRVNDFWMLSEQLMPINDTVKTVNMSLAFTPIARWKSQVYATFEENFRVQKDMMGVASSETDDLKRMFLDTNPILLGVTFAVSLLHSVFDFLAFKNDIQFWKKRKTMEGLSFRTIVLNVVFQLIIFLYLLEQETSKVVLFSTFSGLLIEVWKIKQCVIVKTRTDFPYIEFLDRVKPSKLVKKTQKYDEIAFKYVSYLMYPCLVAYAVYSLVYEEHKGWYSYVIGTLVGFVYAFGFLALLPQVILNYKLKSVSHMPWKTFMYKALNTFVDDLFAFVIKMPWLHRIACLRDDVVFLIYLYQRWIYPEDKRRRNEYGQVGEEGGSESEDSSEDDEAKPAEAAAPKAVTDTTNVAKKEKKKERKKDK